MKDTMPTTCCEKFSRKYKESLKDFLNVKLTVVETLSEELTLCLEQIKSYVVFFYTAQSTDDANREKEEKKRYLIRKVTIKYTFII